MIQMMNTKRGWIEKKFLSTYQPAFACFQCKRSFSSMIAQILFISNVVEEQSTCTRADGQKFVIKTKRTNTTISRHGCDDNFIGQISVIDQSHAPFRSDGIQIQIAFLCETNVFTVDGKVAVIFVFERDRVKQVKLSFE